MDYVTHNIAMNLNRIRKSKGMSLDTVAEQTGVSKSMLAQIEKGTANPSIGVLGKIVSGLRITFDDLLQTPVMDSYLVHIKNLVPTKEIPGQYRVMTCFPIEDNYQVEIYRIEIAPGGTYISGGHGERTREYISVLMGDLTIETKGKTETVTVEDAYRFESDSEHCYRNMGTVLLVFNCFFVTY